jgi:hypothetical protein
MVLSDPQVDGLTAAWELPVTSAAEAPISGCIIRCTDSRTGAIVSEVCACVRSRRGVAARATRSTRSRGACADLHRAEGCRARRHPWTVLGHPVHCAGVLHERGRLRAVLSSVRATVHTRYVAWVFFCVCLVLLCHSWACVDAEACDCYPCELCRRIAALWRRQDR